MGGTGQGRSVIHGATERAMATKKATRPLESPGTAVPEQPAGDIAVAPENRPAFEDFADKVRARDAELTPAQGAAREKHERETLAAASTATLDAVVQGIGELRVGLNRALDGLSNDLVGRSQLLARLEEAIALRSRYLAEFYEIEVAADTLASLVASYDQQRVEFERSALARASELEESLAGRQQASEAQALEAKRGWEEEQRRWKEAFEREKADAKTSWAREKEEREYAWRLRLTREEETFQARRLALQAALDEDKTRAQMALGEREERIAAQENEVAELRRRAEGFAGELEAAVAQARKEAVLMAEERAKVQMELRAKDAEANERLYKLRIQGLEQAVKELTARNDGLQQELRDATDKVRDIALKAIEGASGAAALSRVSEIALQHAKSRDA